MLLNLPDLHFSFLESRPLTFFIKGGTQLLGHMEVSLITAWKLILESPKTLSAVASLFSSECIKTHLCRPLQSASDTAGVVYNASDRPNYIWGIGREESRKEDKELKG